MVFSNVQKELPLVALLYKEKNPFQTTRISIAIRAKAVGDLRFKKAYFRSQKSDFRKGKIKSRIT
jgi:hypothetical protein